MTSYDVIGYVYDGAVYCLEHRPDVDEDERDTVAVVFCDDEWSYEPTCDVCGAPLEGATILEVVDE